MALTKYTTLNFNDYDLKQLQANTKAAIDPLTAVEIINGTLLTGIVVASGANNINHKLNRKAQGYIIVSKSASITYSDSISAGTNTTFVLNCSGAATINIWVF